MCVCDAKGFTDGVTLCFGFGFGVAYRTAIEDEEGGAIDAYLDFCESALVSPSGSLLSDGRRTGTGSRTGGSLFIDLQRPTHARVLLI